MGNFPDLKCVQRMNQSPTNAAILTSGGQFDLGLSL